MLTEDVKLHLVNEIRSQRKRSIRYKICPICKGDSNSFVVSDRGSVVSCYCYRCHQYVRLTGRAPSFATSLQLAIKRRAHISWRKNRYANHLTPKTDAEYETRDVWLPYDCTEELPIKAKLWLNKYHVTPQEVNDYAIKWSPQYERLILPVYAEGRLVYWTGRYFGEDAGQPKYLNVKMDKGNLVFTAENGRTDPSKVVLVEDILSAIALNRAGYKAFALLGCHLQESTLDAMQLRGKQVTIVMWLDQDKMCTSFKVAKRLEVLGWKVKVVVTPLDPKEYTPEQIQSFLKRRTPCDTLKKLGE